MTNADEFSGKVAIVTGAGQGMGRAVAERLAAGGARLALNDINPGPLNETVADIKAGGGNVWAIVGNVASREDVDCLVEGALERYDEVHILVNNAGIVRPTRVIDIEEDEWDLVLDVNLKGTYLCSRAILPTMQKLGWGRIVNFSSTAGRRYSDIGGAHYTAAKAGILGFTRHLAKEVGRYGITVNAVCPGMIDTQMTRSAVSDAQAQAYADSYPISRPGQPREIAELVAFLASDKAAYITGASLDINGGDLMM